MIRSTVRSVKVILILGGKYKLLSKLGSGGFGEIYKGENVKTKKAVAIKLEKVWSKTP